MSRRPRAAGPRLSMTAMPTRYISLGLCSVTLRACSIEEVVAIAAGAGLECIEWGADVHVPPGDLEAAARAREATRAAGLRVASYGSYWRCAGPFEPVLASARELGAPRVRIWAGDTGSREATPAQRDAIAAAARAAARDDLPWGSSSTAARSPTTSTPRSRSSPARACRATGSRRRTCPTRRRWTGCAGSRTCPPCTSSRGGPGARGCGCASGRSCGARSSRTFTAGDALLEFVPGDDPALVAEEAEACRALLS